MTDERRSWLVSADLDLKYFSHSFFVGFRDLVGLVKSYFVWVFDWYYGHDLLVLKLGCGRSCGGCFTYFGCRWVWICGFLDSFHIYVRCGCYLLLLDFGCGQSLWWWLCAVVTMCGGWMVFFMVSWYCREWFFVWVWLMGDFWVCIAQQMRTGEVVGGWFFILYGC